MKPLFLAGILFYGLNALAVDSHLVTAGTDQDITEHTVCKNVDNAGAATRFVPTKTSTEWASFYNNPPSGVTITACAPACGGASVGGYCWYYGALGESCSSVCNPHGGYNGATRTYIGDIGTDANCDAVMAAVGAPGGVTIASATCSGGQEKTGCMYSTMGGFRLRCTNAATTSDGANFTHRACACNN